MGQERERERERETTAVGRSSYYFWGFTYGVDSISEEVVGFSPLWFTRGKTSCSLSLCLIVVLLILSVKDPKIMLA